MEGPEKSFLCRQCGAELPVGSGFCNRCGTSQEPERAPKPSPPASPSPPPPEATLWSGRYSLKAVAHVWLLWALWISLVLGLYLRFVEPWTTTRNLIALGVGLVPGLWSLAQALLRKLTLRYRLTNHRLFTVRGLFARKHDEVELIRVDDVSVDQNLVQRLFDVGTVTVLSTDASNPRLAIEGIEHPLALKEQIRSEVRARRARTMFLETL